jgi:hypothetical protein
MKNKKLLNELQSWYFSTDHTIIKMDFDFDDTEGMIEILEWMLPKITKNEYEFHYLVNNNGIEYFIQEEILFNFDVISKGNIDTLDRIYNLYVNNKIAFDYNFVRFTFKNIDELNWWFQKLGQDVLKNIFYDIFENDDPIPAFKWIVMTCENNNIDIMSLTKNITYGIPYMKSIKLINYIWDNRHKYGFPSMAQIFSILIDRIKFHKIDSDDADKKRIIDNTLYIFDWIFQRRHGFESEFVITNEIDLVSGSGHIDLLNWFYSHRHDLGFNYSFKAIDDASMGKHIDCLKFWFEHYDEFELKYTTDAIDNLSKYYNNIEDHIKVLDLWYSMHQKLGIELKYTIKTLYPMCCQPNIEFWNWWYQRRNELEFMYDPVIVYQCLKYNMDDVEWWFGIAINDGFDLKLDKTNIDMVRSSGYWPQYSQFFDQDQDNAFDDNTNDENLI